MLIHLMPEQVMDYWDILKEGVMETLPSHVTRDDEKMVNVQMSLLGGTSQCWVNMTEEKKINASVITRVIYDDMVDMNILILVSIFGFDKISGEDWVAGYSTLSEFAKLRKCESIAGYSNHPVILKIAEKLGAKLEYTYITLKLMED